MTTVSARDASRGFSALLDRVEHDAEEYTIVRDGKVIARIVPASERTVGGFLARRAASPATDDHFASDAVSAEHLLTNDTGTSWRD
ncbi:type II toxin-antitoxin system Phd/YefM family antitoxin [Microbacterium sp.]|uniref:type II toxin-antitoxin system Phd/YefM family antitoxin n=1 Tax=Microbacterium sp. TaxID=51671 RepID=UPI003A8AB2F2